ncbi:hypothetical protein SDC9_95705 [bioreactor metagenome]|uniref:Uncharacterized protein n=1 Tax=bioreactor metagenome TaxID=1076179 RepID=A0A645A8E7_9ZZZZ
MHGVADRIEHRPQPGTGDLLIEAVGKTLEVDVGSVHDGEEIAPGLGIDVPGSDRDGCQARSPAGDGGVDGVFGEDHRVVIGERDRRALPVGGGAGDLAGAGLLSEQVHLARGADLPVLAVLAGQIAACGAETEDLRARQEMVERFLLNRIDAESGRASIGGEDELTVLVGSDETEAPLTGAQAAFSGAEVALDATILGSMPISC